MVVVVPFVDESSAPLMNFFSVPVGRHFAPLTVFVTPAITTFCTVTPDAILSADHDGQEALVTARLESTIGNVAKLGMA